MTTEVQYPECEKLAAVQTESQVIGEFLDWLRTPREDGGKGVHLHTWEEWQEDGTCPELGCDDGKRNRGRSNERDCHLCGGRGLIPRNHEGWMPLRPGVEKLLAEFFNIDLKKVDAERREILRTFQQTS